MLKARWTPTKPFPFGDGITEVSPIAAIVTLSHLPTPVEKAGVPSNVQEGGEF
jgi:hypothetical protein